MRRATARALGAATVEADAAAGIAMRARRARTALPTIKLRFKPTRWSSIGKTG